ncbi:DUF7687 domain-containing protein [Pseudomonas aeruginosa]|uniref:DUF7687 domain-containing protein n=1 Tax=Pseudomonas aeruginosa TaxID=287 RepID=UPI00068B9C0E|nr:hypothetical protein [Pseudomonas aeruginosa]MBG4137052.1 hypothetical protein [Pseudomonas aeruginosa]MBG4633826.1 hypothetical protein [Pseudomonas aeruginosa]MBG6444398.1 hypothetical protein [Pseudomonas aeruginosa]MBH9002060.1 hypothetical protein [Pseudomonas aeruginosa]MBI7309917.1 hypothetical protein [Pseudomonas aeruginosa]
MKADIRFLSQTREFWANVRTISQEVGYTDRASKTILIPNRQQLHHAFNKLDLSLAHIEDPYGNLTQFGNVLIDYFTYRSEILNNFVRGNLMNKEQAEEAFNQLYDQLQPNCPLPFNKQKAEKKNYAFLTGMVNMLVEANIGAHSCDYDPRSLTTVTYDRMPLRTLSRRVDGAFPAVINPIAIWEIKEYYYTTTFGSRVADGVYESLLDGMELTELEQAGHQRVHHMLVVDDYFTWWECGRSYLCRIIDMLHMGYIDEVIFGREVLYRLPVLVREWRQQLEARQVFIR